MKITCTLVPLILTGILAANVSAQLEEVVVDLTGVRIQNNRNESRSSAPDALNTGFGYSYDIDALVQGNGGILAILFPEPTDIAVVLEMLQPGASQYLSGDLYNPSGAHPFEIVNQRFDGVINLLGVDVTFGMTLQVEIDSNGIAAFSFTDVVLEPEFLVGSATLTSGTLTVTRIPAVTADMNWDSQVNAFDIEPLLIALFEPDQYIEIYGFDPIFAGDCNRDGVFDAFDIESFLDILFP